MIQLSFKTLNMMIKVRSLTETNFDSKLCFTSHFEKILSHYHLHTLCSLKNCNHYLVGRKLYNEKDCPKNYKKENLMQYWRNVWDKTCFGYIPKISLWWKELKGHDIGVTTIIFRAMWVCGWHHINKVSLHMLSGPNFFKCSII